MTEDPWALDIPDVVEQPTQTLFTVDTTDGNIMNPTQKEVFEELLQIGGPRPVCPDNLARDLITHINDKTTKALALWPETTFWVGKYPLAAVSKCELSWYSNKDRPRTKPSPAMLVGTVAHKAIQLSYTHPDMDMRTMVMASINNLKVTENSFGEDWENLGAGGQSDVIVGAIGKVSGFLDSWPALQDSWTPRFEDPLVGKIGKLVLSGRPDLSLGRPRGDGKQTMFFTDFKTGSLKDEHLHEGRFYALLATLRHKVAPWRSCIYSLSDGSWTDPAVDRDTLFEVADWVCENTIKMIEVSLEQRAAVPTPGSWCKWCPLAQTCEVSAAKIVENIPGIAAFDA